LRDTSHTDRTATIAFALTIACRARARFSHGAALSLAAIILTPANEFRKQTVPSNWSPMTAACVSDFMQPRRAGMRRPTRANREYQFPLLTYSSSLSLSLSLYLSSARFSSFCPSLLSSFSLIIIVSRSHGHYRRSRSFAPENPRFDPAPRSSLAPSPHPSPPPAGNNNLRHIFFSRVFQSVGTVNAYVLAAGSHEIMRQSTRVTRFTRGPGRFRGLRPNFHANRERGRKGTRRCASLTMG